MLSRDLPTAGGWRGIPRRKKRMPSRPGLSKSTTISWESLPCRPRAVQGSPRDGHVGRGISHAAKHFTMPIRPAVPGWPRHFSAIGVAIFGTLPENVSGLRGNKRIPNQSLLLLRNTDGFCGHVTTASSHHGEQRFLRKTVRATRVGQAVPDAKQRGRPCQAQPDLRFSNPPPCPKRIRDSCDGQGARRPLVWIIQLLDPINERQHRE